VQLPACRTRDGRRVRYLQLAHNAWGPAAKASKTPPCDAAATNPSSRGRGRCSPLATASGCHPTSCGCSGGRPASTPGWGGLPDTFRRTAVTLFLRKIDTRTAAPRPGDIGATRTGQLTVICADTAGQGRPRPGRGSPELAVQSFFAADTSTHTIPLLPSWSAITVSEGALLSSTTVPPAARAAAIRCPATSGAT
jgi:hypothetical protein